MISKQSYVNNFNSKLGVKTLKLERKRRVILRRSRWLLTLGVKRCHCRATSIFSTCSSTCCWKVHLAGALLYCKSIIIRASIRMQFFSAFLRFERWSAAVFEVDHFSEKKGCWLCLHVWYPKDLLTGFWWTKCPCHSILYIKPMHMMWTILHFFKASNFNAFFLPFFSFQNDWSGSSKSFGFAIVWVFQGKYT